jgi:hypothetical protein
VQRRIKGNSGSRGVKNGVGLEVIIDGGGGVDKLRLAGCINDICAGADVRAILLGVETLGGWARGLQPSRLLRPPLHHHTAR